MIKSTGVSHAVVCDQIERVQGSKSNDAQQHHGFQNKSLLKNAETNKIPKASKRLDDRLEADVMQQRLYEMACSQLAETSCLFSPSVHVS